jgi:hypothetical protein
MAALPVVLEEITLLAHGAGGSPRAPLRTSAISCAQVAEMGAGGAVLAYGIAR